MTITSWHSTLAVIEPGTKVLIQRLERQDHYNHKQAKVIEFNHQERKYKVRLLGCNHHLFLKEEKIQRLNGSYIMLQNLSSATQYNSQYGTIIDFHPNPFEFSNSRYTVKLGSGRHIRVREQNLSNPPAFAEAIIRLLQDFQSETALFMLTRHQTNFLNRPDSTDSLQLSEAQIEALGENKVFSESQNEKMECSICQEAITHGDAYKILPCSCYYSFHSQCIESWLKRVPSCPTCRHRFL